MAAPYRPGPCPNCGRHRVQGDEYPPRDGVCEKCLWDVDGDDYATVTRWFNLDGTGGACCIVCRSDNIDLLTGECRESHWHGLSSGPKSEPGCP